VEKRKAFTSSMRGTKLSGEWFALLKFNTVAGNKKEAGPLLRIYRYFIFKTAMEGVLLFLSTEVHGRYCTA